MSVISTSSARTAIAPRFDNGDEFLHSLGDVPMSRVIFDPWPGTATEQDLLNFVECEKRLCELVDGTLVEKPVGYYESLIAGWLITALNQFVMPRRLGFVTGEAGMMRLSSGRVRLPDVAFVSFDRLPDRQIPRQHVPMLTPDLAVEVLSESNTSAEIDQKLKEYFESGTRLAWIVNPENMTVAVYLDFRRADHLLTINDFLDGLDVLPGFKMPLSELFGPRA